MSKQSKQYESMRQTQINTFSDGLNMDLHPLTTPNTILTDCVNGTMITYNDNEFVLQNERGNTKIDNAHLSPGFIPVGIKEHNGILYIVSHNPQTKESEIGTFPSPVNSEKFVETTWNKTLEVQNVIKYSEVNSTNIEYYDYNLVVSNYDKYILEEQNDNPLIILDHYLLSENGKLSEVELQNGTHRFTNTGSGILGYKYRTYYIDTLNAYINPIQNTTNARLFIEIMSTDKKLIENYKNFDFEFCITVDNITNENGESFFNKTIFMTNFSEYNNLQGVVMLPLDFSAILSTEEYIYDNENKILKHRNGDTYSNLNFKITMTLHKKDHQYSLIMDNHESFINIKVEEVIQPVQIFSIFKYKKSPGLNNSTTLEAKIVLDLKKYNINHSVETIYKVEDASYKLYKIDRNGNIEGETLRSNKGLIDYKTYDVLSSHSESKSKYDLLAANVEGINTYQFETNETNDNLNTVSYSKKEGDVDICASLPQIENAVKVQYQKVDKYIYNVVLLDASGKVLSTTNVKSSCSEDLIDERWDIDTITYDIKGISYTPNSVYLLELTFPLIIDGEFKNNKASFIVVTTDKMLTNEHYELDRMDLLGVEDWYDANISVSYATDGDTYLTSNESAYIQNRLPVEKILNCKSETDVETLAKQVFLKYNQVLEIDKLNDEIPSISLNQNYKTAIKSNDENFNICLDVYDMFIGFNEIKIDDVLYSKISLNPVENIQTTQTSERKYLYDIFKDENWEIESLKSGKPYTSGYNKFFGIKDYIELEYPDGIYYTRTYDAEINSFNEVVDWITTTGDVKTDKWNCRPRTGGCGNSWTGKSRVYKYISKSDGICGVTLQLMKSLGMNNSLCYGKIKNSKHVEYSGNTEKIWIRGKIDKISNYVLIGMNLWSHGDSKIAWEILKKHLYYLEFINRRVVQYKYDGFNESKKDNVQYKYKGFPSQCLAIHNNYSHYNIQSWDNLNYTALKYTDVYSEAVTFDNINDYCRLFLSHLGGLINTYPIPEKALKEENEGNQNSSNLDLLHSDFSEQLFTPSLNFNTFTIPGVELYYDQNRNYIYIITNSKDKEGFEYISHAGCTHPLEWNYSSDFCWDAEYDTVAQLDEYHSLQFYKLTSYESE